MVVQMHQMVAQVGCCAAATLFCCCLPIITRSAPSRPREFLACVMQAPSYTVVQVVFRFRTVVQVA